ncbi:helix-turn-helix domain-containing protein [Ancylobacter sp.]|uniref:helix-turn-helix domain-containing protein n=1 Tax=Ancylobacter sp. TaxID=1872567 RepID=UPI003D122175
MSIHVSPIASRFRSHAIEALPSLANAAGPVAPVRPSPAPSSDESLAVRLGHMGVVISVTAPDRCAAAAQRDVRVGSDSADTIRLEVAPESLARCAELLAGPARPQGLNAADPVVRRLSQALEAAERGEREHGGLYADALRLAILTRLLGANVRMDDVAGADQPCEAQADEPGLLRAPAPQADPEPRRRLKSGLPKWRLKRVTTYIEENLGECVTLEGMAEAAGLSRMHFAAQFRIATGMRPHDYLLRQRIERAQSMLLETRDPLVEIALAVGFQTQAHFTTVFRRFVGDTPYQWRCANRVRH